MEIKGISEFACTFFRVSFCVHVTYTDTSMRPIFQALEHVIDVGISPEVEVNPGFINIT